MSEQKWKPGDVAMIRTGSGFDAVGLRSGVPSNMGWAYTASESSGAPLKYGNCWTSDPDGAKVIRPLVVIDPEDREQVERFVRLIYPGGATPIVNDFQAALREFASPTPPKPDEPLGLGAVVEDAEGYRWSRPVVAPDDVDCWYREDVMWGRWSEIPAVRVLAEGVTP